MITGLNHGSAKIYQFPTGGRAALGPRRNDTKTITDLVGPRVNEAVIGGAWYHDAAIQEAKPVRES